jgi:hypothetical protein
MMLENRVRRFSVGIPIWLGTEHVGERILLLGLVSPRPWHQYSGVVGLF